MNEDTLRTAYTTLLEERRARGPDCVAPESLLAIADGTASEAERLRVLRHVASCVSCRAELELLRTAHQAAAAMTRRTWRLRPLIAAAAGVLLLVGGVGVWQSMRQPIETLRGDSRAAPQLLAPSADAQAEIPVTFTWSAVSSAVRYEIEIIGPAGAVVFSGASSDSTLLVDAALAPGDYQWWVRAVLPTEIRPSPVRGLRIITTP